MAFDWSAKLRNFLRSFGGEDAGPWQIWEQQLPEGCARTPEIIALPGDHGGIWVWDGYGGSKWELCFGRRIRRI